MKTWRFFVTPVLILAMGLFAAAAATKTKPKDSFSLANAQILEAAKIERELSLKSLDFSLLQKLSRSDRQALKSKVFELASLTNAVLALDAKKGVYLTHKTVILNQRDLALNFQRVIEQFERNYGEQFEPRTHGPVFNRSLEARSAQAEI